MELSLRHLVGEVVMLWAAGKSRARSISGFCWISSLSLSLPHHFICDCKDEVVAWTI